MTSTEERSALAPWTETLPGDWRQVRLDAVADVLFSNVDKHTTVGQLPVRLCNYVDVYKNERITSKLDFMEASAEPRETQRFQVRRHDILATKDSEEPDDIAIASLVAEELPGVLCGYHLALIRPRSSRLFGPFVAWAHASKQFRAQYEAQAVGVTRFGLSRYAFRTVRLPLPSRIEQERISAYLEVRCAAVNSAIAVKRGQLETLEAARESLIERAVTRGIQPNPKTQLIGLDWITEIPAHWEVCRIKRVLSRVDYGISEATVADGRHAVLKMEHIQRGEVVFEDLDFVDEVVDDLILQPGDVLYNRTNSPDRVGKAAIFHGSREEGVTFASYLVRLRTNHRADPHFFNYLVNCSGFLSYARKLAIPSVQQSNLNSTRYCRMVIPRPPVDEQREIVAFLDEQLAQLARIVANIESQIEHLVSYRNALIHECTTGQRRVTEADLRQAEAHG